MKTGQVCRQYDITRDTLRFYIENGLLKPDFQGSQYDWSDQDLADLENILSLRQLGLSVKAITRIKELHDKQCGSLEQLTENRQVLLAEIADRENEILLLQEQKENLQQLLKQLEEKLATIE